MDIGNPSLSYPQLPFMKPRYWGPRSPLDFPRFPLPFMKRAAPHRVFTAGVHDDFHMATKKKAAAKYADLHDLLVLKLQSLYDIESQLVRELPKLAKSVSSPELKDAFEKHLDETKNQVARLERALEELKSPIKKSKVEAIRGLAKDAEWMIKNIKDEKARDAGMIAAAQYVEHYEIAGYGSASEWAKLMGHDRVVDLLEESLAEEKAADEKLNELALSGVNERANTMHAPD
jgi:ferritin-like metal-binding protein YciE